MRTTMSLRTLREANKLRLPQFKNSLGQPVHTSEDGSDWSPAQWLQALIGELGEYANFRKKYERGDITLVEFQRCAGPELADALTRLDILARRALDDRYGNAHPQGFDLEEETRKKFNVVSARVGANVFIYDDNVSKFERPFEP